MHTKNAAIPRLELWLHWAVARWNTFTTMSATHHRRIHKLMHSHTFSYMRTPVPKQALDPRLFQSACFPKCGCTFADAVAQEPHRLGQSSKGLSFVGDNECEPRHWLGGDEGRGSRKGGGHVFEDEIDGKEDSVDAGSPEGASPTSPWLLRHFACTGATATKAKFMKSMLEGVLNHTNAKITRNVKGRRLHQRTL